MNIDEALYQLKQRIKMHELEGTTSNENEREKVLLDYITNLKEDNAELRNEVKELERMCELYGKSIYNAELTDYKSRNEKAIEYINAGKTFDFIDVGKVVNKIQNDLLNILQGEDNKR